MYSFLSGLAEPLGAIIGFGFQPFLSNTIWNYTAVQNNGLYFSDDCTTLMNMVKLIQFLYYTGMAVMAVSMLLF